MKRVAIATLCSLILLSACDKIGSEPLVIGHRGAMGHEIENTLASVQKALDLRVDMIEIDVFKIQSGEIVVFHDERVERLTNGGGRIEEYNVGDLNQLILDGNHKIPLLQEVLQLVDNKVALNIELKGTDMAERVNFIADYYVKERGWAWDNFVISSFNWNELMKVRQFNKDIKIAVLTEEDPLKALSVAKELKAVAINPNLRTLTAENISEIQQNGFKVYTWTVNEHEDIARMKDFGVDGIITNHPERVR